MSKSKGLTWILSVTFILTLLIIFGDFLWFEGHMSNLDSLYYKFSQEGYQILNTEHDLREELIGLEAEVRGFLLFQDEDSLASYNQRKEKVFQIITKLEVLLPQGQGFKTRLREIRELTDSWIRDVLQSSVSLPRPAGQAGADGSKPFGGLNPRDKDKLFTLLNKLDELENESRSLLEGRMDEIHQIHQKIVDGNRIFFGFSAVIILALFIVAQNQGSSLEKKTAELIDRENRLSRAVTELQEASRLKSEFLANVSHELRTPLNAIIGFSQVLQKQYYGPLNEKQASYVNYILTSGQHLVELITDILDLSKIEAGKMEIKPTTISLCEVIKNSLLLFREKAAAHRLELSFACEDRIPAFQADEQKLRQILFNLLSNAVKFTPDGGKIRVIANLQEDGKDGSRTNWVKISVIDTGIGIPPAEIKKLFQPFVQLDGGHTRQHEGTGLGLSLVKKLVELHGGRVWAESQGLGKGSTFSFTLPLTRGEKNSAEGPGSRGQ